MTSLTITTAIYVTALLSPALQVGPTWPQWRGPWANGMAPDADPPTHWSETKNILWKVKTPGSGSGSPIVWGDKVFIQAAVKTERRAKFDPRSRAMTDVDPSRKSFAESVYSPAEHIYRFVVLAYDRRDGHLVWQRDVREELPHEVGHQEGSLASASPVTDGEHLFAYFGSRGLYALDMAGRVVWEKDFGNMITRRGHGEGSSPALYRDTIVVNWDHEGASFIVALDKHNGQERWRRSRDEFTSWATPLIVEANGRAQVVVSATNRIRSYDLETGQDIWQCSGMTVNVIPTPVATDELVFAMSGYRGNALRAIRFADARGDVTDSSSVAWSYDQGLPYVPSPLLSSGKLYFLAKNRPMLSCLDAATGKPYYIRRRLKGLRAVYASPVAAAGRVYVVGRDGKTVVLEDSPSLRILAENSLDDFFDASPAIVGQSLYLRGHEFLYCVSETKP